MAPPTGTTADPRDLERRRAALAALLDARGQGHLLRFADRLEPDALAGLLEQLESLDVPAALALIETAERTEFTLPPADAIRPARVVPHAPDDADTFRALGETAIRAGEVAAFTVAGGQGTRLGWRGPKGSFPATPVSGRPLFRVFAEQLRAIESRYGVEIPWYIMTSPINDADTRAFFRDNNWFDLNPLNVTLFEQGVLPSYDAQGRMLLEAPDRVAVNPDGHGGALRALRDSGALDDMQARGVRTISYFQVDNPLVRVVDPLFLGLHASHPDSSGEMSSKMVPKRDAAERVGVFCSIDGRTQVVEYSDLPTELAEATDADGALRFNAGSIAIHLLSLAFARRLTDPDSGVALPIHRARKKVPHLDPATGEAVAPTEPNATKLELFIFDALPLAESSLVWETERVEEFAPIKNAEGEDSAATSHALQSERAARWLESAGVAVPRGGDGGVDAVIEITAATALDAGSLRESIESGTLVVDPIEPGTERLL